MCLYFFQRESSNFVAEEEKEGKSLSQSNEYPNKNNNNKISVSNCKCLALIAQNYKNANYGNNFGSNLSKLEQNANCFSFCVSDDN